MDNRDFKGIWIPKEIWLNPNLTMIEKVILMEIDSLDNENHCTASNEYLAEFCNCSESAITKAINHLIELGFIEKISFDGRVRKLGSLVKFTIQSSKIYYSDQYNLLGINIDNNKEYNNKNNSKELFRKIEKTKENQKPKKSNKFQQCVDLINEFTTDLELSNLLISYLKMRLEIKDKQMYINQWKGLLNKLNKLSDKISEQCEIVQQSLDRGYASFYKLNTRKKVRQNTPWNSDISSESYSKDELQELDKQEEELNKRGVKTRF